MKPEAERSRHTASPHALRINLGLNSNSALFHLRPVYATEDSARAVQAFAVLPEASSA